MNYYFISASVVLIISLLVHTIPGNKQYIMLNPRKHNRAEERLFRIWLTGRSGFQMVTIDLLLSAIFIFLMGINVIDYNFYLALFISLLFLGYSIFWILTLFISKAKIFYFVRLCHWCIFLIVSVLVALGMSCYPD